MDVFCCDSRKKQLKKLDFKVMFVFSVDYDAIAVDDIVDIHNCLMKKNEIV